MNWDKIVLDGKEPDAVVGARYGVSAHAVKCARQRRGIRHVVGIARRATSATPAKLFSVPQPVDFSDGAKRTHPVRLVCWVSDVHFPDEDPEAWKAFSLWLADVKPDTLILGGDILELESASQHGGVARPRNINDELDYAVARLTEIRGAVPDAEIHYLEGNHETRLSRIVIHQIPTMDGAITLKERLHLDDLGISWHRYGSILRIGKIGFTHGWYASEHHAAKHLRELGESIVYGHTHKAQSYTKGGPHGVRGSYGMPCLRTLAPDWLDGRPCGWSHGFGAIYVDDRDGSFNCYTVQIVDGKCLWNGRVYSGR